MIEPIVLAPVLLALALAAGVVLWAWRKSVQKRRRLAAAYERERYTPEQRSELLGMSTRRVPSWPAPPPALGVEPLRPLTSWPAPPPANPPLHERARDRSLEIRVTAAASGGAGGSSRQGTRMMSSQVPVFPARPADIPEPGAILYGDPVRLAHEPDPAAFTGGHGGSFGGAGASGGWDPPGDNGGGYSGQTGAPDPGPSCVDAGVVDCTPTSSDP